MAGFMNKRNTARSTTAIHTSKTTETYEHVVWVPPRRVSHTRGMQHACGPSRMHANAVQHYMDMMAGSINQSIKNPHRATHGQGEADLSTATVGSKTCATK